MFGYFLRWHGTLFQLELCGTCAEHVSQIYTRYASIISIWFFGRMGMVDMAILRIRFFEIEKCKHVFEIDAFLILESFCLPLASRRAFFLMKVAILDVRNMCGTRCAEHVRNMEHVPNLWNRVPCQLSQDAF